MKKRTKVQKRVDRAIITEEAWRLSIAQVSFTSKALAARLNMPCNRHFQAVLNELARNGLLLVARPLCDDGHYRKYFYGKDSQIMFEEMKKAIEERVA